jgi:hypothetical protein
MLPSYVTNHYHSASPLLETLAISGFTYFNASRFTFVPPMRAAFFSFTMLTIWKAISPSINNNVQISDPNSPLVLMRDFSKIAISFIVTKALCNVFNQGLTNTQILTVFGTSFIIYQIGLKLYQEIYPKICPNK